MSGRHVAIVVKGYPRLSETFIAQEILGLQQRGQRQLIVSLRWPTDPAVHELNRRITAPVLYLPEYLHRAPLRVWRGWRWARRRPGYRAALSAFLRDLRRDRTRNRIRRFGQACVLARELPDEIGWLHCHYLHTPASTVRYAAAVRGLGWSFSAHAKDIWTTPRWDLQEKLADAAWGVTCTAANWRYLAGLTDDAAKLDLVYHGLDLSRFPAPPVRPARTGADPADPVRLLSVGRAVEKKGFDVLLDALARLPSDLHWRWVHVGGGMLLPALKRRARALGLESRVTWRGALEHGAVCAAYRDSDLFVLAAKVAHDGDRDGLPNVLMEAQASGLACLATAVSAIPELIEDGVSGRLVPPGSAAPLAEALAALCRDPAERARLAAAGADRVRRDFAFSAGLDRLCARFGLARDRAA